MIRTGTRISMRGHTGRVVAIHGTHRELLTVQWDGAGTSQVDTKFDGVTPIKSVKSAPPRKSAEEL